LLLCPLAIAGMALLNAGLGRSRSAAQSMLGSMLIAAIAALMFAIVGVCWAGNPGHAGAAVHLGGKSWDWIGLEPVLLRGVAFDRTAGSSAPLATLLEIFAVALAGMIPWGSGADRWRLAAASAATVILAAWIFPLLTHWVTGTGWLRQLGASFGLGSGFLDAGNAATVHVLGGVMALCVVWLAGPRRGKFPRQGISTAIPGHNVIYVLFGCLVCLAGWVGWNSASALVTMGAPPEAIMVTAANTVLSAAAAVLASYFITQARFGKPDPSLCANGWMAGLVASSATAALVSPAGAILVGCVAGVMTPLLVELLELGISLDDPSGAITVHGAAGIWGLLAAGLLGRMDDPGARAGQILAQLVGVATLLGLVLPMTYLLFWLLNKAVPFRVDPDGERLGMDLHELGGGAYPEFVIHRDEFHR
jgi:Amt family ammonium transporter